MNVAINPHSLSLVAGIRAAALRTPARIAVVGEDRAVTYADLLAEASDIAASRYDVSARALAAVPVADRPDAQAIVAWLAALLVDTPAAFVDGEPTPRDDPEPGVPEDRPAAIVADRGEPRALSHRAIILRALNSIVVHASFARDGTSAVLLPLGSPLGVVAAVIPLWLGATLHLLRPGSIDALAEGVASGRFDTAWLGPADYSMLAHDSTRLSRPAVRFRLAVCAGLPMEPVRSRLVEWLGPERVTAETADAVLGAVVRHPGLSRNGEPVVGALIEHDREGLSLASTITADPPSAAWQPFRLAP
jgi:hypothetical protein